MEVIILKIANNWEDYEILDMSNGMKKERWGKYVLLRPDPQIIWNNNDINDNVDAIYYRSKKGGGHW